MTSYYRAGNVTFTLSIFLRVFLFGRHSPSLTIEPSLIGSVWYAFSFPSRYVIFVLIFLNFFLTWRPLGLAWRASCTSDYTQSTYIFRLIIAGLKWRSQVSINSRNSADLNISKTVCVFIFFQPFEFLTLFIEFYIWIFDFLWRSSEDSIYHFKMSLACFQKTAREILFAC